MSTRELWKVTVEYTDRLARPLGASEAEWNAPRKTRETHAAVYGDWGATQIAEAGRIAVQAILGDDYDEQLWQPIVVSAEFVGTVTVQEQPK